MKNKAKKQTSSKHLNSNLPSSIEIIVLAAGLGTRMKSEKPKVLHAICGEPMLGILLQNTERAIRRLNIKRAFFNIVVGYQKNDVIDYVDHLSKQRRLSLDIIYSIQDQQLGTGHAVKIALENTKSKTESEDRLVAILNGDLPLFDEDAFVDFFRQHLKENSVASLVSAELEDPFHYGRVVRKGKAFTSVVEFKDASEKQKKIREINGGVYLFDQRFLRNTVANFKNKNKAHEFYLPDAFSVGSKSKKKIAAIQAKSIDCVKGINTFEELIEAQQLFFLKTAVYWLRQGVRIHDPKVTYIGPNVVIGPGTEIFPMTFLLGQTEIGENVTIDVGCRLKNVRVERGCLLRHSVIAEDSKIGSNTSIGPMVHLRPGTVLGESVRIGNFVEIKQSTIGNKTNAAHLSYIGDAVIGEGVNVGCGFITCNFDGRTVNGKRKHETKIGNNVFIGSDCQTIAPIEIADGTYIASGSTVSESVKEKDSLVVARNRQTTKPGYAKKYRS